MAELLIMEPNGNTNREICEALTNAGHACHPAMTVSDAVRILDNGARMATVLNARMPWKESMPFLRLLEEKGLPVLFMTSDAANAPHLRSMYASCCEVVLTPCAPEALVSAVTHLLETSRSHLHYGPLRMDTDSRKVTLSGAPLTLTAQEFALLQALMEAPDTAVSREKLLRKAWGYEAIGITRTVDVHVQRLRRKLGAALIETVYKTGYRLRIA